MALNAYWPDICLVIIVQCYIPEEITSNIRDQPSSSRKISRGASWSGSQSKAGSSKWDSKGDKSTQLSSSVTHQQTTVSKTARTPSRRAWIRTWEHTASCDEDFGGRRKVELRNTISSRSGGQHSDVEKLRDLKVKTAFILQLQNNFQVLADAEDQTLESSRDTNTKWWQLKIAYEHTCKACQRTKQRKRKKWITEDTWEAIEDRRTLKKKVFEAKRNRDKSTVEEREASQIVKRVTRTDKQILVNKLVSQAEDVAGRARQSDIRNKQTTTKRSRYTRGSERPGCQH